MAAREPSCKQSGLPPMVNIMWITLAKSRSVRGESHHPAFMGNLVSMVLLVGS